MVVFISKPDIDECAQNSTICEQLCVNTDGGYFCSCDDGYELIEGTNQCIGEGGLQLVNN